MSILKVLLIRPGYQPEPVSVEDSLQAVQALLGGIVGLIQFPLDQAGILHVVQNREVMGPNRYYKRQLLCGDFLVVGTARSGFKSLSPEQFVRYKDMFRLGGGGE